MLTVEWEGIQTGDHPDDSVGGFAVEYRAEKDTQWHVHDGIIPYKGPNLQYRVQVISYLYNCFDTAVGKFKFHIYWKH